MQHILLLGAGRSSSALIQYLLHHAKNDNYHVTVGDISEQSAQQKTGNHSSATAIAFDIHDEKQRKAEIAKADVVISLLPPALHFLAAVECVQIGRHLITASYISGEIESLHHEAIAKGILLLNECGLDPGIDHMSAVELIHRLKKEGAELISFKSYTGGLIAPESVDNPWGYKFTWNPRNVILAGQGTAKYIEDGKYRYLPYHRLFTKTEKISIDSLGIYEGYANRDSLAYRKHYEIEKIPTLLRGTLRQEHFCSAWNVFVQLGITDDTYVIEDSEHLTYAELIASFLPDIYKGKPVKSSLASFCDIREDSVEMNMIISTGILDDKIIGLIKATPAMILQNLLEKKWVLREEDKDLIVMQHLFEYKIQGRLKKLTSSLVVKGESRLITAMAKTVGYPLGIVARLLLKKKINLTGAVLPISPELYNPVLLELKEMGIGFSEKEIN